MTKSETRADFTKMTSQLLVYIIPEAERLCVLVYVKEVERHPCAQLKFKMDGKAWTLKSFHLKGLAIDLVVISLDSRHALWRHEIFDLAGAFWISIGGEWGGEDHWIEKKHEDRPHFQYNKKRREIYLKELRDARKKT